MKIDKQTPPKELQQVTQAEASILLGVPPDQLSYSAWPQTVKNGEALELVTGEAWTYLPSGGVDTGGPHPAVVFHRGVVLGTVADLGALGGFLDARSAREPFKDPSQSQGRSGRRTAPRRGVQARNMPLTA